MVNIDSFFSTRIYRADLRDFGDKIDQGELASTCLSTASDDEAGQTPIRARVRSSTRSPTRARTSGRNVQWSLASPSWTTASSTTVTGDSPRPWRSCASSSRSPSGSSGTPRRATSARRSGHSRIDGT